MTEGERTEPDYFKGLARAVRATGVRVVKAKIVGSGSDPETVVRQALSHREREEELDACWCVVDVDSHATLDKAIALAFSEKIALAISNPCFEVWLIWHYADLSAHVRGDQLRQILRGYGFRDKTLPKNFPFGNYREACRRAERTAADLAPGARGPNPSSSVGALVIYLVEETGKP
ncbi:RloB family protein [Protofrankia symbiont of Coriaria ruscifolia]|uniref:RloB family protein n=1 Tax=Protofrankia symbiont of Coriaria ruscifolia TaxID=1306542 RepID=UPI001F5F36B5|nr:RloB family protein [Protofrankia symbiont of Coriaria ruscifolia]